MVKSFFFFKQKTAYEISNFARAGYESRHNLKYWTRQPYLGFGVDAHSMLPSVTHGVEAVRFSTLDTLEQYVSGVPLQRTFVSPQTALEESFFLGLRLTQGVSLQELSAKFGKEAVAKCGDTIAESVDAGLMQRTQAFVRLTSRGR